MVVVSLPTSSPFYSPRSTSATSPLLAIFPLSIPHVPFEVLRGRSKSLPSLGNWQGAPWTPNLLPPHHRADKQPATLTHTGNVELQVDLTSMFLDCEPSQGTFWLWGINPNDGTIVQLFPYLYEQCTIRPHPVEKEPLVWPQWNTFALCFVQKLIKNP